MLCWFQSRVQLADHIIRKDVAENLTDVEQHIPLPIAIMIPRVFSDYYSLLGLGDIVCTALFYQIYFSYVFPTFS